MPVTKADLPPFSAYFKPTVDCFKAPGGSMTIEEMEEAVAQAMGLSDEVRAVLHNEGPRSQFEYELAWVRTYLKKVGALENSERGVWATTEAEDTSEAAVSMSFIDDVETYVESLSTSIVQILTDDERGMPAPYGTALLVSSARSHFLVSAAHVFDPLRQRKRLYFGTGDRQQRNLVERSVLLTRPRNGTNRSDDRLDIGVLRMGPHGQPPYTAIAKFALPVGALQSRQTEVDECEYLLLGYPVSKTTVHRGRKEILVEPHGIIAQRVKDIGSISSRFDTRVHIGLRFNRNDGTTLDGRQRKLPKPSGMSGSPIWVFSDASPDWIGPTVVGIAIEYISKHQMLVGTDIAVALDMMRQLERAFDA